jgi:hypothetical protein
MPQLTIRFALENPPFNHGFVWKATEAEFAQGIKVHHDRAAGWPVGKYLESAVTHAPTYLSDDYDGDPTIADTVLSSIVAYALLLPVGRRAYPGTVSDYIGTHDFIVTFLEIITSFSQAARPHIRYSISMRRHEGGNQSVKRRGRRRPFVLRKTGEPRLSQARVVQARHLSS